MPDDRIRYDILVQEAARGVMRKVLQETARAGLPGNHHFFITFVTGAPGVRVSSRLKERYPEQMTIVIQHQYWDLDVNDKGFEIVLSFADTPEKLEIPFSAVRGFYDPTANFEMEFDDVRPEAADADEASPVADIESGASSKATADKRSPAGKAKGKPRRETKGEEKTKEKAKEKAEGGADVVSLDSFRKK